MIRNLNFSKRKRNRRALANDRLPEGLIFDMFSELKYLFSIAAIFTKHRVIVICADYDRIILYDFYTIGKSIRYEKLDVSSLKSPWVPSQIPACHVMDGVHQFFYLCISKI